jgi:hypothetical protein
MAAQTARDRKKARLNQLEAIVEQLREDNAALKKTCTSMEAEVELARSTRYIAGGGGGMKSEHEQGREPSSAATNAQASCPYCEHCLHLAQGNPVLVWSGTGAL